MNDAPLVILRPDDAKDFAMLHAACFSNPWPPRDFRQLLTDARVLGLGVQIEENLKAAILLRSAVDESEILTICVSPDHQRSGLAKHLLKTCEKHLSPRGITKILLDVAENNVAAVGLYEDTGYRVDGRRKGYYREGQITPIDAILMSKSLALKATGFPQV